MPLNNGDNTSAGVYKGERDNSIRATATSTSVGAIVGPSHRGPIGVPTLVVDEDDFVAKFGESDEALTYMHYCARAFLQEGSRLYVLRVAENPLLGGLKVVTDNNFSTIEPITSGIADPENIVFDPTDIMYVYGANPGAWNNNVRVLAYPDVDDQSGTGFVLQVFEGASQLPVEVYRGTLHDALDGYGKQKSIENQLEEANSRVRVLVNHDHPAFAVNPEAPLINAITSGSFTEGSSGDPINASHIMEGWEAFEDPEDITVNLLINCGYTDVAVQQAMLALAEARDDCFAILDVPSQQQETSSAINFRRNTLNANTSYGALYSPDVLVRDTREARDLFIPPSGHIAAAYAYTDRVTAAWFAPAGLNRGQLNVQGLRWRYKQGHRDALAENQVNVIKISPGEGIVIWGADTLQSIASALSNVNVRRLVSLLKTSIANTAEVGVYEPNDSFLRVQLRSIAEDILGPMKRGRGLYGYEIVCDDRNNTNDTIAAGDVILDVYVDPVIPAKRIHLNAVIPKTGQIKFAQELMDLA